jgi:hypothetical protein
LSSEIYCGFRPIPAIELLTIMVFRGGSIKKKKKKKKIDELTIFFIIVIICAIIAF